ncbi:uncharacterized protein K441DRAFT_535501 [Cenococcum geophilum 1.58]|uniref:uncharacterized protein n=1 Tax=Cenococcum geophilum 1.58 TaxID=794803 RepID=UPI00358F5C30|nr:hypothetical protein K441DRAFT_535501 [Cenococcum geophilum 1.58]
MCDYTQVHYKCTHLRYTVRAWCTKYQETQKRCPANVVAIEYRLDENCGEFGRLLVSHCKLMPILSFQVIAKIHHRNQKHLVPRPDRLRRRLSDHDFVLRVGGDGNTHGKSLQIPFVAKCTPSLSLSPEIFDRRLLSASLM